MAQETLKLTITADTKEALDNLNNFIKANKGLKTEMQNFGKVSNQATQALSNLSRVAQDAPYGFMGIANNLNPLLESFQRLRTESTSGKEALKALGSSLIGPAGLGLALGVISSLIVKFGDDIQAFISEKAVGLGKAFTKESELITKGSDGFVKAQVEIANLNNEFTRYTTGVSTKEEFLKKFNSTLGDTIKETKDLAVAEKFLTDFAPQYVQMTFKKAIANEAATQAAKKQVEAEIAKNRPSEAFKGVADFTTIFFGGTIDDIKNVSKARQATIVSEANKDVTLLQSIRDKYNTEANKIDEELRKLFGKPIIKTKGEKADDPLKEFSQNLKSENNAILQAIQRRKELGKTASYIKMETPEDKAKAEKQRLAGIKLFGESKMTGDLGKSLQGKTSAFYEEQKKINEQKALDIQLTKEQTEANLMLADTLSNYVANSFMNLFASMEQGMSLGEALGNMFLDLAKQIAAAAIKALAFQAILSFFSGGAANAKAITGGFGSVFKGLLGLASGGIVTGPTLAMVGEGNESEAVMPLSKLGNLMNNTFNAGAMASNSGGGNGEFILRGQDLVLAMNRSETSLKYRRG